LDEAEINLFKAYGMGPYAESIKKLEEENKEMVLKINKLTGSIYVYMRY
jgi:26S proteasome regulatory subunit T1